MRQRPTQLVTFEVAGMAYGLDIRVVKEINPTVTITSVPRTEAHIRGLVNIRGQVVLVLDVATVLGKATQTITEESQIVILKTSAELRGVRGLDPDMDHGRFGDKPSGFFVDKIGDVIPLAHGAVEETPLHVDERNIRFFDGVAKIDDAVVAILNAGALLSHTSTSPKPAQAGK